MYFIVQTTQQGRLTPKVRTKQRHKTVDVEKKLNDSVSNISVPIDAAGV